MNLTNAIIIEENFEVTTLYKVNDIIAIESKNEPTVIAYVTNANNGKVLEAFDGAEGGFPYLFDPNGVAYNANAWIRGKATYEEICKWFADIRKQNHWFTEE